MSFRVPNVKLNNGQSIPIFGLGTWKSKPGEVAQAVKEAIDIGYRLIDTAYVYNNEKEIGEAVAEKIAKRAVKREELYITTKLWNTYHSPELVEQALKISLENLSLEYIDLYLMHWPFAFKETGSAYPLDEKGKFIFSDVDYIDTWKAMELLYKKGLTKSIGISNFNQQQIERLLGSAEVIPVVNQVECHPYMTQTKMSTFLKSKNIHLMAYSPLGSPDRPWAKPGDRILLQDPKVNKVAMKLNKTSAQVLIKYQIQRGHIVIPKSASKDRLQQNYDVFDFDLSPNDIKTLSSLNCHMRFFAYDEAKEHKDYPFKKSHDS